MTGAKPISIAHRAKDETSITSCTRWTRSLVGNFQLSLVCSVIWCPPVFLNEDINTPEILKLLARLSAILIGRDHRSLTSVDNVRQPQAAAGFVMRWSAPASAVNNVPT